MMIETLVVRMGDGGWRKLVHGRVQWWDLVRISAVVQAHRFETDFPSNAVRIWYDDSAGELGGM
jgi:hypothetical protein